MSAILKWIHDLLPCPNEPKKFYATHHLLCADHYSNIEEPGLWGDTYDIVADRYSEDTDCEWCIDEREDD